MTECCPNIKYRSAAIGGGFLGGPQWPPNPPCRASPAYRRRLAGDRPTGPPQPPVIHVSHSSPMWYRRLLRTAAKCGGRRPAARASGGVRPAAPPVPGTRRAQGALARPGSPPRRALRIGRWVCRPGLVVLLGGPGVPAFGVPGWVPACPARVSSRPPQSPLSACPGWSVPVGPLLWRARGLAPGAFSSRWWELNCSPTACVGSPRERSPPPAPAFRGLTASLSVSVPGAQPLGFHPSHLGYLGRICGPVCRFPGTLNSPENVNRNSNSECKSHFLGGKVYETEAIEPNSEHFDRN